MPNRTTLRKVKEIAEDKIERLREFLDSDSGYATATKVVLALIAVGGIVVLAGVAPNIFQIAGQFKRGKKYKKDQLRHAFYNLKRANFIKVKSSGGKIYISLTEVGKRNLGEIDIDYLAIHKPWRWDGKWRLLMFDIPVRFRKAREAFRYKLKDLGLVQYQKSVWLYPYPCLEEIVYTADFFEVGKYIEYVEAEYISHERRYKEHFDLL